MDTRDSQASSDRPRGRSRFLGDLGWFGGGAALAALCALMGEMQAEPVVVGETVLWTVDRDASRLYGLDRELLIGRAVPVDYPLEVESVRDGGSWVLRSGDGTSGSSARLDRLDPRGVLLTELYLENCRALGCLERLDALVLENVNGTVRLSRVREEGSLFPLCSRPDLASVCGSAGSILCGTDLGAVVRIDPTSGAVLGEIQLGGRIGDVAPGPEPGSVWALDVQGTGRLLLLDAALSIRWSVGVGFPCAHVGPVTGEESAWVADTSSPRVRRFGPGGLVALDRQNLPAGNFDRTIAWRDGGALLLSPSAIVHVHRDGTLAPGQGGFAWLGDAARLR